MHLLHAKAAVLGSGGVALLIAGEPVPGAILATIACEALRMAFALDQQQAAAVAAASDGDGPDDEGGGGGGPDDDRPDHDGPRPHVSAGRSRGSDIRMNRVRNTTLM